MAITNDGLACHLMGVEILLFLHVMDTPKYIPEYILIPE